MYIEQRTLPNATILDCFGQLVRKDQEAFMERFESLQSTGCRHLIINMTSLYHLDPSIVETLDFISEYLSSAGGQLTLISPLSAVRQVLEEAGAPAKIPTFLTLYDALHRRNVARFTCHHSPTAHPRSSGMDFPEYGQDKDTGVTTETQDHIPIGGTV